MPKVSESNRTLAKLLAGAFGGKPRISRYWDQSEKSWVDVMFCGDSPEIQVSSYATLGLSDHRIAKGRNDSELRVELVAAFGSEFQEGANIISSAAFCIINSHWDVYPGAIFPEVVRMYRKETEMKHVLLCPPFLWDNLTTQVLPDKTVAWLMLVPISESECRYAEEHGSESLEEIFVEKQIDVFDLDRASVL